MNKQLLKLLLVSSSILLMFQNARSQSMLATFEDAASTLNLPTSSFWDGSALPLGASFESGGAVFPNFYDTAYGGYWASGWALSTMTDTLTGDYTNLFSARPGKGHLGSATYAIGQQNAILKKSEQIYSGIVDHIFITNTTYAAESMKNGDFVGKKFGSIYDANGILDSTNGEDWFKLSIQKYRDGILGDSIVEFYLADFRGDSASDYIVTDWRLVDLISLASVDSLLFTLSSSDTGLYGINTPAFFAIDDLMPMETFSINKKENYNYVSLFPNPAESFVNLRLNIPNSGEVIIRVYNALGEELLENVFTHNEVTLSVGNFPSGIYNVQISGSTFIQNTSFVKQ